MNDCIWCFILEDCGCKCRCDRYVSVNSDEGGELLNEWERRVEELLEPLREEYKSKFESEE